MRRTTIALSAIAATVAPVVSLTSSSVGAAPPFPQTVELTTDASEPTGFQAEGIAARGRTAYAGSLTTGEIVTVDLITGEQTSLVAGDDAPGAPAVGLALDGDRLYVAGGPSGELRVYDTSNGDEIATLSLSDGPGTFVNDVTVTPDAVYATDSFRSVVYRVPLGADGSLGDPQALELTGDFELADGFNANGIVSTGGGRATRLVIAQSTDPVDGSGSALYVVDPSPEDGTAEATRIELDGDVSSADGLLLRGRTLYVVENVLDRIAVVKLAGDLTSGTVTDRITDDDAATPTTAAFALGSLYAVNARFADQRMGADPATLDFELIRFDGR
ncbi:YncE family protein [Ilumatobacter sp.]|uniref:YncE family protein n=1 Tax=Ilumatobacter sp. TaxID=1967498 RepID=UPI003B52F9C0